MAWALSLSWRHHPIPRPPPLFCFLSLPPPSRPRLAEGEEQSRRRAGRSEMAAGLSCLKWRSRARLGTAVLLCSPAAAETVGWWRRSGKVSGVDPTSRHVPGESGPLREASLRGRGGLSTSKSLRDGCPWPRGEGEKLVARDARPSCFLAFVIGLRSHPLRVWFTPRAKG